MRTTFPSVIDLNAVYRILWDYTRFHFPIVNYRVLDVEDQELDPVYLEVAESGKSWEDAVELRAYFVPDEETYPLTRYGLEQVRDVVVQVAVPDLVQTGLVTMDPDTYVQTLVCGIGDRFEYSGVEYDVLQIVRGPHFGNTDVPIYYFMNCEKVRPESDQHSGI